MPVDPAFLNQTEKSELPMYCRKCGKNIPDDSEYCPYCGIPTIPGDAKTNIPRLMLIAALPLIAVILICVLMVIYLPSRDNNDVILILNNTEVVEANWAADGYAYTVSFENMGLTARSVAPILSQIH